MDKKLELENQLKALQDEYIQELPKRLDHICDLSNGLITR